MPSIKSALINEGPRTTWSTRLKAFGWETKTAGATMTFWIRFVTGSRFRLATMKGSNGLPVTREALCSQLAGPSPGLPAQAGGQLLECVRVTARKQPGKFFRV